MNERNIGYNNKNVKNQSVKRKYDVFVVDDNFDQASIMKLLIEQYGFRTKFTTRSKTAYQTIAKYKPRLVILDLMMPEIDGLHLCKLIKENPHTAQVKILIYSGKLYDSDKRKAKAVGADLFLTKPTKSQILIDSIRRLLNPHADEILQN
jgi:PleD family two-component response regulator